MKTSTHRFSTLVKRVVAATMAVAMLLTSATLPTFAKTEDAGKTYNVPVKTLESGAPLPPVQVAFAKAFGEQIQITEKADGSRIATVNLQHMVVDMSMMGMGKYECNVQTVTGAKVLATETRKLSPVFGNPDKIVDNEVPTIIELALPEKDKDGKYPIELTVDFMDHFLGGGKPYPTDVKLVLDEENRSEVIADYTKVDEALAKVPADLSVYTKESAAAVTAAQDAIVRDLNVTEQARVDEMAANLEAAINALEMKKEIKFEDDAIYEVQVALWNAEKDKPSMAASSLKAVAKIFVKDGKPVMHIYTQPMTMGSITASLEELRVYELNSDTYNMGTVVASKDGKPVEFAFDLPHTNEFIRVDVNPHVAMMGNAFIAARIKVDYDTLTKVGTIQPEEKPEVKPETKPEVKPEVKPETKPEVKPEAKPELDNENPHTADSSNVVMFSLMGIFSAAVLAILGKKSKASKA